MEGTGPQAAATTPGSATQTSNRAIAAGITSRPRHTTNTQPTCFRGTPIRDRSRDLAFRHIIHGLPLLLEEREALLIFHVELYHDAQGYKNLGVTKQRKVGDVSADAEKVNDSDD